MSSLIYPEDGPSPHELLVANHYNALAHMICDVQPINIGDPTRGGENIFTVTSWGRKYENKQYMMWEDDGGFNG